MELRIIVDDAAIERLLRRIVAETLGQQPPQDRPRRAWLCNGRKPADLLKVVEAPDTAAEGVRDEPHWRGVRAMARGDLVLFRDAKAKVVVGHATADRREQGEHREQPGVPALRWLLTDPVRYDPPLADERFIRLFREHQQTDPGFPLLSRDGGWAHKSYLYPLDQAVVVAIGRAVGMDVSGCDHEIGSGSP